MNPLYTSLPHSQVPCKAGIRQHIARLKKSFTPAQLQSWSDTLLARLEETPLFRQSHTVLLYHSLPDEVHTHHFIEKWCRDKQLLLPVVKEQFTLEIRHYTGPHDLRPGPYGISEPSGPLLTNYRSIDLALIPGVAFDLLGNRLGRGKGYYDRLLSRLDAPKIGICYHFQFLETPLPTEDTDIPMNQVITDTQNLITGTRYPQ